MVAIFEHIKDAWQIIWRNLLRSVLTMMGIIIGVMSLIIIMSVGAGAQSLILNQIKGLGSNLVGILPGKSEKNGPPAMAFGIVVTTLTTGDIESINQANNPHILAVTPYVRGADVAEANGVTHDTTFVGVNAEYPDVETVTVAHGRFFSDEEEKTGSRVAVLGSGVADALFADIDPIGRIIRMKRTNFVVLGVLGERGTSGFQDQDNQVFVPVSVAQKLLLGINYVSFVRAKIDDAEYVDSSIEHIESILRQEHGITNPEDDDFSVRSTNQGLAALTGVTNVLRFFLAAIAALSLVVGGIGIMNIMLAVVEERTKEIGLRKALGATNRHILVQFLTETVVLTCIGGTIGVLLGIGISFLVAAGAEHAGYQWDFVVTPSSVVLSLVVSLGIGLVFGIRPAEQASRLNPIESLRYE